MQALDYLLPQPLFDLTPEQQAAFDDLFASTPQNSWIHYQLLYPKWQFLSYLCRSTDLVLHGSQSADITIVEPRKAMDVRVFSGQKAIYATTDGIWAMFFAIIDRKRFSPLSLFNSCLNIQISADQILGPLYFFSITHSALLQKPWCDGVVYILLRENFEQELPQQMLGASIIFPHWTSFEPAEPVAKLLVQPQDFPFLAEVHGHNDEKLARLAAQDANGFPWPEALET